ncbi:hypothetical protein GE061_005248 [Apolygus lucorum]|uniref:Pseudouridine synthase I TruA alpha/beta domain-containing protein n=1 Tax=Apolygus lucorum TaxID=248454 RepID=A0A8S9WVL5_APOLU|nr:hypothetical protein GE061_005248 [Apolygus lucorum]
MSKEELIEKVAQLQAHNVQLRNIIAKKIAPPSDAAMNERSFDFSKCHKMHVLLRILYLGWNYQGFACQEDSNETIEFHLMKAFLKCKLIASRDTSNYHRCGRTDKGVSSFGQVISLTVRAAEPGKPPLAYCKMLNRLLPNDIRAVAWREAAEGTSARFDCKSRSYKYYFPKSTLNLDVMNNAVKDLIGTHDFRNICKMDVGNGVTTFVRNIADAKVSTINDDKGGYQMCELSIVGNAFLWHQVRCIASLILLVGQGLEDSSIVKDLLDVQKNPRKPQYVLARPESLNLFKCDYEFDDWNIDEEEMQQVIETLQRLWTENQVKSVHLRKMLSELEPLVKCEVNGQISSILRRESKNYKPLLTRHKCQSLEDRIEHYAKKLYCL